MPFHWFEVASIGVPVKARKVEFGTPVPESTIGRAFSRTVW
ncbi:MAG: hypothetical protein U0835_12295 [Isosphaeraceae bacterium]